MIIFKEMCGHARTELLRPCRYFDGGGEGAVRLSDVRLKSILTTPKRRAVGWVGVRPRLAAGSAGDKRAEA